MQKEKSRQKCWLGFKGSIANACERRAVTLLLIGLYLAVPRTRFSRSDGGCHRQSNKDEEARAAPACGRRSAPPSICFEAFSQLAGAFTGLRNASTGLGSAPTRSGFQSPHNYFNPRRIDRVHSMPASNPRIIISIPAER
jgi:hypothetical protein